MIPNFFCPEYLFKEILCLFVVVFVFFVVVVVFCFGFLFFFFWRGGCFFPTNGSRFVKQLYNIFLRMNTETFL